MVVTSLCDREEGVSKNVNDPQVEILFSINKMDMC